MKDIEQDIKAVFGNVSIRVATRKRSSIGNLVIKNKSLCMLENANSDSQKCGATRCKICPLMMEPNAVKINDKELLIPQNVNCKSKNVIYLCICKKCVANGAYFGQTVQNYNDRMSGHRDKFFMNKYKKSALSWHAYDTHGGDLALTDYDLAVIKKVTPRRLHANRQI